MIIDAFLQNFKLLTGVPNSMPKLRELILQLALQGKLVPQDHNDLPAHELLRKIESEKKQLIEAGKLQNSKPLSILNDEEIPYSLPQGWQWTRLGNVVLSSHAGRSPQCLRQPRTGSEWGVLKVSAVSWGSFDPTANKALPPEMQPRLEDEVKVGDFLLSRANTDELVARSVVVAETPPHLMISDKIVRLVLSAQVEKSFINLANSSRNSRSYYADNASGTSSSMKNVSRGCHVQPAYSPSTPRRTTPHRRQNR
jgi:type I restriction enzyme S subunit